MLVIVQHITHPDRAADAFAQRGDHKRAQQVRALGCGRHLVDGPVLQHRDDAQRHRQKLQADTVPGLTFNISTDYDPDWSLQRAAANQALSHLRHGAIAVVNAYHRAYFHWGDNNMITGPNWRDLATAINFRDGARLVVHALADLYGDPAPLIRAAQAGFTGVPARLVHREQHAVHTVTQTLAETGQGVLADVIELIQRAVAGDS